MKDRRVVALSVSIRRCERLADALRRELGVRRQEVEAQIEQCRLCAARLDEIDDVIAACNAQLDAMTCGDEPFSLDGFNELRRYMEVVAERQRACAAELERQQAVLDEREAALMQTRRGIATNDARIEFIKGHASKIERELDHRASDAADDDVQEEALARLLRERSSVA
ncbi:hypothetical protein [Paraburkholderia phosphatilytica]|uniref:hypothetical protein n=1 Tax=Paraburkholderia phosphatilytica TaxID=2282883 RepID=UPI000E4C1370|nr:hypothetical protein [Paraburkholderia phosphatilytica]